MEEKKVETNYPGIKIPENVSPRLKRLAFASIAAQERYFKDGKFDFSRLDEMFDDVLKRLLSLASFYQNKDAYEGEDIDPIKSLWVLGTMIRVFVRGYLKEEEGKND